MAMEDMTVSYSTWESYGCRCSSMRCALCCPHTEADFCAGWHSPCSYNNGNSELVFAPCRYLAKVNMWMVLEGWKVLFEQER